MTTRTLRSAIAALAFTALSCGGGDPPGGGNNGGTTDGGDTTDGTTGNGGTDGYVPNPSNPLIAVIPGTWEYYEFRFEAGGEDIQGGPPDVNLVIGQAAVDRNDQNCSGDGTPPRGPIGDACIHWMRGPEDDGDEGGGLVGVWWLVLMDDRVIYDPYRDPMRAAEGRVLEGGQRIEYRTHPSGCAGGDGDDCTLCPTGDCSEKEILYDTEVHRFRKLE